MNEKRFRQMELIGIPVCFALAVLLHFLYGWSGYAPVVGVLAAANESVWEHGKLLCVPYLLWAAVEWFTVRPPLRRFLTAKTAGLYTMLIAMTVFYYLYTWVAGTNLTAVDVLSAAAWVVLGFAVSTLLMKEHRTEEWFTAALFAMILLLVALLSFTINPPQCFLFRDPQTGAYGLRSALPTSVIPV